MLLLADQADALIGLLPWFELFRLYLLCSFILMTTLWYFLLSIRLAPCLWYLATMLTSVPSLCVKSLLAEKVVEYYFWNVLGVLLGSTSRDKSSYHLVVRGNQ